MYCARRTVHAPPASHYEAPGHCSVSTQPTHPLISPRPPAGFRLYDGPVHISNLTARGWPAGTAPLALRSSNGFQMAAATSVKGFRPEGASYRFLAQVGQGWWGSSCSHTCFSWNVGEEPSAKRGRCKRHSMALCHWSCWLQPARQRTEPVPATVVACPAGRKRRWRPHSKPAGCGRLPFRLPGGHAAAPPAGHQPRVLPNARLRSAPSLRAGLPPAIHQLGAWRVGLGRRRPAHSSDPHARQPIARACRSLWPGSAAPSHPVRRAAGSQGQPRRPLLQRGSGHRRRVPCFLGHSCR